MSTLELGYRTRIDVEKDHESGGVRFLTTTPHFTPDEDVGEGKLRVGIMGFGHVLTKHEASMLAIMLSEAAA